MDSPVRKQQKRNDYLRHKMFRKINRRKKAERKQAIEAPMKELRKRLRRYDGGKKPNDDIVYETQNTEDGTIYRVHPSAFGAKELNVTTPEVVVKTRDPRKYVSAFDPMYIFDKSATNFVNNSGGQGTWYGNLLNYLTYRDPYYGFRKLKSYDFSPSPNGMNIPELATLQRGINNFQKYDGSPIHINNKRFAENGDLYNMYFLDKDTLYFPSDIENKLNKYLNGSLYQGDQEGLYEFLNSTNNRVNDSKRDVVYDAGHFSMKMTPKEIIMLDSHDTGNPVYDSRIKRKPYFVQKVPIKYGNYDNNDLERLNSIIDIDPDNMHDDFRELDITNEIRKHLNQDTLNFLRVLTPPTRYSEGKGSGIHIKPENRGKFTRLKKRTGKSASWFKAHGTPAQKKMATFALNAKKWKH